MARYRFVTVWHLDAAIEDVWEAIFRTESWPKWWDGVESVVELEHGNDDGVGSLQRYTWKSVLPYELSLDMRVTRARPPVEIRASACGELTGGGHWRLYRSAARGTIVRYDWDVRTTKTWMNALVVVARGAFAWNHDRVMERGGEGLARLLGARLL
jgi:hypothetical protein